MQFLAQKIICLMVTLIVFVTIYLAIDNPFWKA
jgi:hypothetical protein